MITRRTFFKKSVALAVGAAVLPKLPPSVVSGMPAIENPCPIGFSDDFLDALVYGMQAMHVKPDQKGNYLLFSKIDYPKFFGVDLASGSDRTIYSNFSNHKRGGKN